MAKSWSSASVGSTLEGNAELDDLRTQVLRQFLAFPAITKEAHELTAAERIALCIAAGCEMDFSTENTPEGGYRMVARTKRPVGITKIDGKFHVAEYRGE